VGLENCVLVQVFRDGQEVARREGRNTVVQDGMALLANRAFADEAAGPNRIRFMQLGKGGTAPTSAQTNIGTEISSATLSGRQTAQTMAMSGTRTAKWEHTWTAGEFAANGVREVGLFDQSTTAGGEMFARFTFTTVNKTAADTIKVTWTLKIQ
jgi:hypothetical protein